MKAKNQAPISSELDAKEKLIVYVYEYLTRSGAKRAAQAFLEDIGYEKAITFNTQDGPGFLANWWCVFWDLYCAAPDKRNTNQAEPSSEARAFIEYNMRPAMSPHHQTSPPQPPYMNAGPRYAPPPPNHPGPPPSMRHPGPPMNVGPPRMSMGQPLPPPQMGGPLPPHSHGGPPPMPNGPHHGPPPPPQMMGGAPSPRFVAPGHMTPPGGMPMPGGVMHPAGGPPRQQPMPQSAPPQQSMQPRGGGNGPGGGWQGGYGMHSPADQQCFIPGPPGPPGQQNEFGGMMISDGTSMMEMKPATSAANSNSNNAPTNQQQDEYVMPSAYQSDQGGDAGSEIRKLKESLESDANEGDQTGFDLDFSDPQAKWGNQM